MFPPDMPNPFGIEILKETRVVPAGHVSELHAPVLAAIHRVVATCRASGAPSSVLVHGEAGSGKTHLLAQLRDELKADPAVLVVGMNMMGSSAGRLWRHVRKELAADLLRTPPGAATSGLTRILHARYPQWGTERPGGASMLDIILGRDAAPRLATYLAGESDLPSAMRSVLAKLYEPATQTTAADWLKGDQLADDKLAALGLPTASVSDQELEAAARDVVLALCRLAAEKTTLVLGVDNVETVQATLTDEKALRELAWLVGELATGEGARVVVTFVRPETMVTLRKAADKPAIQRMASVETQIPRLGRWEHVVRLVAARFEASPAWQQLRKQHADPYWPLGEPFLRGLMAANKLVLTPRHLVGACRVQLERLRTGGDEPITLDPAPAEAEPSKPKTTSFDAPWQKRRDKYEAQPAGLAFDTVVGLGLPWLREAIDAPFALFEHQVDTLPDVNLLFRPVAGGRMVGVSCCDHAPAQLWRRLDRLKKQWGDRSTSGVLQSLVLVRQETNKLSKVAETRLAELKAAGVRVLLLPREQYAELAAYQQIFANTQAGNYTDFGRPVTVAEFAAWANGHLSSAVKELAAALFGGPPMGRKPAGKAASKATA